MKIFHAAPKATLEKIKGDGVVKSWTQVIPTYDDYGQEDAYLEDRAYICTDPDDGEIIRQALTNVRGVEHILGEFETAQELDLHPDPRFVGKGFYVTSDILIFT